MCLETNTKASQIVRARSAPGQILTCLSESKGLYSVERVNRDWSIRKIFRMQSTQESQKKHVMQT